MITKKVKCINCENVFETSHSESVWRRGKNKKCCSLKCSHFRIHTSESKNKLSKALKRKWKDEKYRKKLIGEVHSKNVGKGTKGKFKKNVTSLLELSSRTVTKILKRINLGCSNCGWNEETCDIHHIKGRKIKNADSHDNLTYLCPNCHRLAQRNKIPVDQLITLTEYIGEKWKEYYYG